MTQSVQSHHFRNQMELLQLTKFGANGRQGQALK